MKSFEPLAHICLSVATLDRSKESGFSLYPSSFILYPFASAARTQGHKRTDCIPFLFVSEAGNLTNHLARFP